MTAPLSPFQERVLAEWQTGKTAAQIATELSTSRKSVQGAIKRARDKGADVPFREPGQSGWDVARVKVMTDLLAKNLSATEVAKRMGMTRNQIIGKASRLGLKLNSPATADETSRVAGLARARIAATAKPRIVPPTEPTAYAAKAEALTPTTDLINLGAHMCKWPIGDPRDVGFGFCGRTQAGEGPYCLTHTDRAFTPPARKAEMSKNGVNRAFEKLARKYA